MIRIVSTFNPEHWDRYVKHNILSWLDNVGNVEIIIYHEKEKPADYKELSGVVWRQLEAIPGAADFIEEARRFPPACGRIGDIYNYNYDAHKFCRKVFAQNDAAAETGDLLIWLDSDVEIFKPVPQYAWDNAIGVLPIAAYLRPGFHTESGIVIWNLRKEESFRFFVHYINLYMSRMIYTVPKGWHDCWAMDHVIAQHHIPVTDLCNRPWTPSLPLDVVGGSDLGQYMRHDKGRRKHG